MNSDNPKLIDFINILAICHTIVVDKKNGKLVYNASSPDELALTNAARFFGIVLRERDEDDNVVVYNKFLDQEFKYQILNVIEFNSTRKRMTVVVRTPDSQILVMTKGADSIMIPRLRSGQKNLIDKTNQYLTEFANEGLRTLILAQKQISNEKYNEWSLIYQ